MQCTNSALIAWEAFGFIGVKLEFHCLMALDSIRIGYGMVNSTINGEYHLPALWVQHSFCEPVGSKKLKESLRRTMSIRVYADVHGYIHEYLTYSRIWMLGSVSNSIFPLTPTSPFYWNRQTDCLIIIRSTISWFPALTLVRGKGNGDAGESHCWASKLGRAATSQHVNLLNGTYARQP